MVYSGMGRMAMSSKGNRIGNIEEGNLSIDI